MGVCTDEFLFFSVCDSAYPDSFWAHLIKEVVMLWTLAVVLFVLWLLGLVSSYTMGGFIHILLVLAIITVLVRIIQGQQPV